MTFCFSGEVIARAAGDLTESRVGGGAGRGMDRGVEGYVEDVPSKMTGRV
jgi:hypothetical protein